MINTPERLAQMQANHDDWVNLNSRLESYSWTAADDVFLELGLPPNTLLAGIGHDVLSAIANRLRGDVDYYLLGQDCLFSGERLPAGNDLFQVEKHWSLEAKYQQITEKLAEQPFLKIDPSLGTFVIVARHELEFWVLNYSIDLTSGGAYRFNRTWFVQDGKIPTTTKKVAESYIDYLRQKQLKQTLWIEKRRSAPRFSNATEAPLMVSARLPFYPELTRYPVVSGEALYLRGSSETPLGKRKGRDAKKEVT